MSTFARATILTLLCGIAACLDGAGVPTSQTADQSINGTTVLPATGWGDLGVTSTSATDGSVTWCCTTWFTPLSLGVGDSVGSLTVPVRDNGSANGFAIDGNNVIIVLTAQSSSGSTVLGSVTSNGSGNPQTLTLTLSTGYTVPTGVSLVVKAIALTGGAIPGPALHSSTIGAIQVSPPPPGAQSAVVIRRISGAIVQPGNSGDPGAFYSGGAWHFNQTAAGVALYFPLTVTTGETITGWSIWVQKNSSSATSVVASLVEQDSATAAQNALGFTNSLQAPNPTISATGISFPVQNAKAYMLSIYDTTGSPLDSFTDAEISIVQSGQ